jgi:hypothetical protein
MLFLELFSRLLAAIVRTLKNGPALSGKPAEL